MSVKISAAIAALILGSWVFSVTLVHSVFYSASEKSDFAPRSADEDNEAGQWSLEIPEKAASTEQSEQITEEMKPSRLIIPRIDVEADVEYVGLTQEGAMGTPVSFTNVAWYKYGAVPGQQGSAVLAGHIDNGLSLPGVFKNLQAVAPGDEILVVRRDMISVRFIVTDVSTYANAEVPTDEIFNKSDDTYLRLISCTGRWDRAADTYDRRIVVTAVEQK